MGLPVRPFLYPNIQLGFIASLHWGQWNIVISYLIAPPNKPYRTHQ